MQIDLADVWKQTALLQGRLAETTDFLYYHEVYPLQNEIYG
jgi:hypothetical protein